MAKAGLVTALGLVAAAQSAPLAAIPLLMDAFALGADRLGIAVAAGLATTLALAPGAGALADRWRPSRMASCGLVAICAASVALCGYTALVLAGRATSEGAFAVVLATRIANGAGVAALHPAAQAWLWAGANDDEGARLQGRASAAQNAGRFFGPISVALVGSSGVAWTLAALAALCASALLVLALTPGPAAPVLGRPARRADEAVEGAVSGGKSLLAALLALHLLGGGAQFLLGPLLLAHLGLEATEAARWAGWLMALAAVASVAGNLLAHRLPRRRRAVAGAALATAGAVVLAPFAGLPAIAAGVFAAAAGLGLAVPPTMAELMRRSPPQARARTAGRTAATQAAAYAVAAPAYGIAFSADPVFAAALLPLPAAAAWLVLVAARHAEVDVGLQAVEGRRVSAQHPGNR